MSKMLNRKFIATILLSVLSFTSCTNSENSSIPVYSKPQENSSKTSEDSDFQSADDTSEQMQNKLEDELKKEIESLGLVQFNTVKASNVDRVLEFYRNSSGYFTGDDDPLNFIKSDVFLVAERDKDVQLLSYGRVNTYADVESTFTPMKHLLRYNETEKRAYFFTFSKGEVMPKTEIFENADIADFFDIMGMDYTGVTDNSSYSDDGLPYNAIEDLDVIAVSKYPLVTYPKTDFRQNGNLYTADFVRCIDTFAMNIKYNNINSVTDAELFDDDFKYWGDENLTENYNNSDILAYTKEIRAGDEIGQLTVKKCYSVYADGVQYDEEEDRYYNYVTSPTNTYMAFDGEITLTGFAFLDNGRIVFTPYAKTLANAIPIIPPSMVVSEFAFYENSGLGFVYALLEGTQIDITGSISDDFKGAIVKEIEITLKNPEILSDASVGGGIKGSVTSVQDKGNVL